ncbi:MAG: ATP-binding protein [Cyclobacteriaceae bacterium]
MRFSDIPGHNTLKHTLVSSYYENHVAHAQLFSGAEGNAAMALALAYTCFLLCENKTETDACGKCANCQKTAKLIHPDVHFFFPGPGKGGENKEKVEKATQQQKVLWREFLTKGGPYQNLADWSLLVDAENKKTQIGKEDAKNIIRTVSMKSFEGSYKVILVWYPEMMNASAANAILKVLEEPPAETLYLLVSFNYEALLTTILSRSQLIRVPNFSDGEIAEYLVGNKNLPASQAKSLAGMSEGNMRKALLDVEEAETLDHKIFADWMRACLANKYNELIRMAADFRTRSKSQQKIFLQYGITIIRQAILAKAEVSLMTISGEAQLFALKFSKTLPLEVLSETSSELGTMMLHLDRNANAQLAFMAVSLRLSGKIQFPNPVST